MIICYGDSLMMNNKRFHLLHGFLFDLTYAFPGDPEPLGHFLERPRMLPLQPEAQFDDLALADNLWQRGVSGLITNRPAALVAHFADQQPR